MNVNTLYFTIVALLFNACSAQKSSNLEINTKVNKQLIASRKAFVGKLNSAEYTEIRKELIKELKAQIPENQSILINYYQYGTNCYEFGLKKKHALNSIENSKRISSLVSKENNTSDFFVYSPSALNKERFEVINNFILDTGFLEQNIFTLKENCRAFFILKTNGEFMKYYGSDYFSEVSNFLKKK